jgi:hypothetical protein
MNFFKMMRAVADGEKAFREVWGGGAVFVAMSSLNQGAEKSLSIYIEDKIFQPWTVSASDVAAQDWKLVDVKAPEKETVALQTVPETPGRKIDR